MAQITTTLGYHGVPASLCWKISLVTCLVILVNSNKPFFLVHLWAFFPEILAEKTPSWDQTTWHHFTSWLFFFFVGLHSVTSDSWRLGISMKSCSCEDVSTQASRHDPLSLLFVVWPICVLMIVHTIINTHIFNFLWFQSRNKQLHMCFNTFFRCCSSSVLELLIRWLVSHDVTPLCFLDNSL